MIELFRALPADERAQVMTMIGSLMVLIPFALFFIYEVSHLKSEISATRAKLVASMEREAVATEKAAELRENLRITKRTLRQVVSGEEPPAACSSWWPWPATDA